MPQQTNNNGQKYEMVPVKSFKDLVLNVPEMNIDWTEDAWEYGAPPPKGVYIARWVVGQEGPLYNSDPKDVYFRIPLVGKIEDDKEWEGVQINTTVDTRVFRGKRSSTAATFLWKSGQNVPEIAKKFNRHIDCAFIAELVTMVLKKEPKIRVELDWKGSYSYPNPKDPEKNLWKNVANKYEDFPLIDPKNPKEGRVHVYTVTGVDGLPKEIRAQLNVRGFLGKDEQRKERNQVHVATSAPSLMVEEPTLESEEPTFVGQAQNQQEQASMELMLDVS